MSRADMGTAYEHSVSQILLHTHEMEKRRSLLRRRESRLNMVFPLTSDMSFEVFTRAQASRRDLPMTKSCTWTPCP